MNKQPFCLVFVTFADLYSSFSISSHHIHPLIGIQCDALWFQMRMFSITSSTVEDTIKEQSREITTTHLLGEQYKMVSMLLVEINGCH